MRDATLNPEQKILLKLSDKNVIYSTDSSCPDGQTRDIYEDLISLINANRGQEGVTARLASLFYLGSLKRMLNRYRQRHMTESDKRLLETFFHDKRQENERRQIFDHVGFKGLINEYKAVHRNSIFCYSRIRHSTQDVILDPECHNTTNKVIYEDSDE